MFPATVTLSLSVATIQKTEDKFLHASEIYYSSQNGSTHRTLLFLCLFIFHCKPRRNTYMECLYRFHTVCESRIIERQCPKLVHVATVAVRVGCSTRFDYSKRQRSVSAKVDLQFDNHCSLLVPTYLSLSRIALGMVFR